jgi:hypothetical protein
MPTFVVIRREFSGYQAGQVVDASTWRNLKNLLSCRHVREASAAEDAEHEVARVTAATSTTKPARRRKSKSETTDA